MRTIEEAIRNKFSVTAGSELHDRVLARVRHASEQSEPTPALREAAVRTMIMKVSTARIVVAALVGTGVVAAAVGVTYKYHFLKTDESGRLIVVSEDGRHAQAVSPKLAGNPQQAVEAAEELELLKQQRRRELVGVLDTEVNGRLDNRKLEYRYTFSDGRTANLYEDDPETGPGTLVGERQAEAMRLRGEAIKNALMNSEAEVKEIPTCEKVIQGRTFVFHHKFTFALSDGTEVAWWPGQLKQSR